MSAPPPDTEIPPGPRNEAPPRSKRSKWVHVVVPVVTFGLGLGVGLVAREVGAEDEAIEPIEAESPESEPGAATPEEASVTPEATQEPGDLASATPAASPTARAPDPQNPRPDDFFAIGDRIHFAGMEITYTDVEITKSVGTVDGDTIEASDGEVLVLLSSDFTNPGPETVDLSCSGVHDAYIQMFDWDDNEIAPVFETYRVPGNPGCNEQLLVGQDSQWNTLWRAVEGSEPAYLTIADTNTWNQIAVVLDDDVVLTIK